LTKIFDDVVTVLFGTDNDGNPMAATYRNVVVTKCQNPKHGDYPVHGRHAHFAALKVPIIETSLLLGIQSPQMWPGLVAAIGPNHAVDRHVRQRWVCHVPCERHVSQHH
jgi:hypothetical protein